MKKHQSLALTALLALCLCVLAVSSGFAEQAGASYTVTFFDNFPGGGETMVKVAAGGKAAALPAPERLGYAFAGWFDAYDGGAAFDFDKPVTADASVFAHWDKTANIVTLKYNDEGENKTVLVADGEKLEQPEDPVSEVYSFLGWFLDGAYTKPYDFDAPVTAPLTIYAGFSKSSARITFNLNYTGAPDPVTAYASMGSPIALPDGIDTQRAQYRFEGWYLKSFPADGDAPVDLNAGIEEDTTVYAKWVRTHFAVEFDPNLRGMDSVTVEVPVENPVAQIPDMIREGYTTDETWYEDAALTKPVDLTAIADDMTVYAKWNVNTYTISFDGNDGTGAAPETQAVEFGSKVARPENPARDGYTFLGWFTDAQDGEQFNFENNLASADLTLFAHWMQAEGVGGPITVTFDYNAPKLGWKGNHAEIEINSGEALGADRMPDNPKKRGGQIFMGWYTDPECTTAFDPAQVLLENTTVYARILGANTFEAEYVNLKNKFGVGSSVELNEGAMMFDFTKIGSGTGEGVDMVSNDFYVAGMYYKGAFIEFEITSKIPVDNCVLEMRVSTEFKELQYNPLTPETYRVDVYPLGGEVSDATNFEYELPLTLPEPNTERPNDPDGEKTPFQNVIISYKLHLDEGTNVIRFTTNNSYNYGAGTFQANAPMIDCITVYAPTDAQLRMKEYREFYDQKEKPWEYQDEGYGDYYGEW